MNISYDWLELIQANGWFILIGFIALYYAFTRLNIQIPHLIQQQRPYTHNNTLHRTTDEESSLMQMQRIEAARLRQQATLDAAAAKFKQDRLLKEREDADKRSEEWQLHQQGLGYKSKAKVISEEEELAALGLSKKNLNQVKAKGSRMRDEDDFNPLTGQSRSLGDGARPNFRRSQPSRGG